MRRSRFTGGIHAAPPHPFPGRAAGAAEAIDGASGVPREVPARRRGLP
ncbi:MAG: hypothetical protein AB1497_06675 [Bacillota bacterium]